MDTNGNGTQDEGEPDLANIDINITDANGNSQIVESDENGDFNVSGLPLGDTVVAIDTNDSDMPYAI